jgi:hypothetical protein
MAAGGAKPLNNTQSDFRVFTGNGRIIRDASGATGFRGYGAGMNPSGNRLRWLGLAALAAALVAILPVAIGASFWHTDAPGSEATCQICHVAHMPVLPGIATSVQAAPKVVAWIEPARTQISHSAPTGLDSPPRAPPA